MDALQYRIAGAAELDTAARVLGRSYRAAYRGLMDDAYLDGLAEDHWAPILRALSGNTGAVRFYAAHGFEPAGAFAVEENGMRLACVKMRKYIGKAEGYGDET